jgi:hypothetical protein
MAISSVSLPGMTRQSTVQLASGGEVDGRVEPGHDSSGVGGL